MSRYVTMNDEEQHLEWAAFRLEKGQRHMIKKFNDAAMIRSVLKRARTGLWIIEIEEGKLPRMYADYTMLELLGIEKELEPEACYEHWFSRIAPESVEEVLQAVEKIASSDFAEVQYPWNHPKWGEIFVRCGGVLTPSEEGIFCMSGYHQNITDVVRLTREKEKLEASNEELLGSLHNMFFGLYRVDLETEGVTALRTPEDVVHFDATDYPSFIRDWCRLWIHPEDYENLERDFTMEHFQDLHRRGVEQFTREYRRKLNGSYCWVSFTIYFCELSDERKWAIIALNDVDERKRREEERNQALIEAFQAADSANHAKTDFLSRMSHDIRTPINAIIGMTAIASARAENPERVKTCLSKIDESSRVLLNLVNEVLEMSRFDTGKMKLEQKPFQLSRLICDCADLVEADFMRKRQKFSLSLSQIVHDDVIGDGGKIQQILLNLLTNANKYTQEEGEIGLSVRELSSETAKTAGYQIECRDNGIGMSEEFLPHIFEAFERSDDSRVGTIPGTGLGMTITQNLVSLMNGGIEVASALGKGSCFTVVLYLELQDETDKRRAFAEADRKAGSLEELRLDGKQILLAEDNEINQEIVRELLEMTGAVVDTAVNGQEALRAFEEHPGQYDLILMDIKMPVMDGNAAAAAIRRHPRGRDIPIIALTANAFAEDIAASRQAGMNEHLAKPVDPCRLVEILQHYIAAYSSTEAL